MGKDTGIAWTHHTFNPWMGCIKISPACKFCYAEVDRKMRGQLLWGPDAPRQVTSDSYWKQPIKWDREARELGVRRRAFCGSLCDVMEEYEGSLINGGCCIDLQEIREHLYHLIERTPNLDWLLLTKRPENFYRFLPSAWTDSDVRQNVWLMTTVESSEYLWRIEALRKCPAVVHGLSIEPLLGDIPEIGKHLDGIDWVIVGGESGAHARPMALDWARRIRDACVERGISFFFKQWGEWAPAPPTPSGTPGKYALAPRDFVGPISQIDQYPRQFTAFGSSILERVGKKAAGNLIDGEQWLQFPEVSRNA